MENGNQIDKEQFLWKVIDRFDTYIGSTNSKTAIIVAFNTFVITGIILKWSDIGNLFIGYPKLISLTNFLLIVAALSSTVSLWFVFKSVDPFLESPERPTQYTSAIFFGHVSKFQSPEDYATHLTQMDAEGLFSDLANQAHVLSQGTSNKFRYLHWSTETILFCQIPSLVATLLMKIAIVVYEFL